MTRGWAELRLDRRPPRPQAMYERLFCWIVGRINDIIEVKNYDARVHGKNTVIGVLDIYGFEIFQNNRFGSAPTFQRRLARW